ncbi:uncharacterized protein [Lepeophtheirus salmonis]|nr:uncharacterized protein LOC121122840 [Lepeophtheirus salmonis]
MDEATVLKGLIDKIRDARENLKLFKDETDDIDSCPQNKKSKINNAYEKSAMIVAKETELLGSSVVEELPGDDGAQYFLAIAGMQKNIQNLRELKQMSEHILSNNMEHIKEMDNIVQLRDSIDHECREKMEKSKVDKGNEGDQSRPEGEAETIKDLEANIRDTRAAYKHIKSEFAAFLERIDHNEINQIGMFLQALWTSYAKNVSNDESSYLRISHLDFDVNQNDVSKLVSEGIITAHPDDPDQVKLMRFKR